LREVFVFNQVVELDS